jgi:hypothetical protein
MTRGNENSAAQIADTIGYLRRQLTVVGLALDALRSKDDASPGLDGLEELVYEIGQKLASVESQIHPEQEKRITRREAQ